ncbi:hypothetical protein NHH73_14600 [Oxalobacteraceae bacterium OTU3CINTB1]|nr:hypothetical protein NHH73_14600 [Oxalobacteraceae bacterium OTU3CINTB1]
MQYGVRAVIGTTFAGIFFDNCARNGLLALSLPADVVAMLTALAEDAATNLLTVDLERQTISAGNVKIGFEIDAVRREALMRGLDAVGQTLTLRDEIVAFQNRHFKAHPWFL